MASYDEAKENNYRGILEPLLDFKLDQHIFKY